MKSKSTTDTTVWKCTKCSKKFRYESDMRRHELSHVPQFECKRCCKKFSYVSALRRHEKTHERSGSVQCSQCGGNFRDEALLKRHVRYAHKGTYKCDKCTATFSSEPALSTHMKTHRPESERRYRCSFGCGKSFNFSHHLKHHEMTHTNTKQHFCQTCGKGFIQSHHLKTHEKSHEPKYWLPCIVSDCKKKFVDEYARKRHLAAHRKTYEAVPSSDSSVYPLNISPSKESQDGELHPSRPKPISLTSKIVVVDCKSLQEQETLKTEILNPPFVDYDREDSKNNRLEENNFISGRDNYLDARETNSVDVVDSVNTCKTAIGSCLVTGESKIDKSCLCAQITNPTGESEEEIALAPQNETLDLNEKSHEPKCWLPPTIPDCKKKIVKDSIRNSHLATQNAELHPSQQKPIEIHSSDGHIIIGCKSTQKQRTVITKTINPLFTEDDNYEDLRNNNKENYAVYGRGNSRGDCDNNSIAVKISNISETEEFVASNNKTLAVNQIDKVKDINVEVVKLNSAFTLQKDYRISNNESLLSNCEGCECANLCSIRDKISCSKGVTNIEYIPGGIVKLRDTFDFDFQSSTKEKDRFKDVTDKIKIKNSECKSSNLKSCKDVIGNCIVSGNSTMGEGCLCARMMVDDQALAEEIDEITPCPQGVV